MQRQDSRGPFDRLHGDNIQGKPVNYFAIKLPRYANKDWLKTAYTIVQLTAVQRGLLPAFAFFHCACSGIRHMEISPSPYLSDEMGTGREELCRRRPTCSPPTAQVSIAHTRTHSSGQENTCFLTQQAPTEQGN